jgi:hypothetical protein
MEDKETQTCEENGGARSDDGLDPKVFETLALDMVKEEELAIFRRFEQINILDLLLLQMEVQQAAQDLATECLGKDSNDETLNDTFAPSLWFGMNQRTQEKKDDGEEKLRQELLQTLRKKLRRYSQDYSILVALRRLMLSPDAAVLELSQLKSLEPPEHTNVLHLRGELKSGKRWDLPEDALPCWINDNDDDFLVLRSGDGAGISLKSRIKFYFQTAYWNLRGDPEVGISEISVHYRVLVLLTKGCRLLHTRKILMLFT